MLYFLKFWETFLKSNSTQKKFKKYLKRALNSKWIKNIQDRKSYFLVECDAPVEELQKIFWVEKIEKIQYRWKLNDSLDSVCNAIDSLVKKYDFETFRVSARREDKTFPIKSPDIQMKLWKYIHEKYWKTPSYKVFDLEIHFRAVKWAFWLRTSKDSYSWVWWLPYACEWRSLTLFSWWIDSPVASFLAAKRWVWQDFLFVNTTDSELLLWQVFQIYAHLRQEYWIFGKFFSVDISHIIKKIKDKIPSWYRQIVFKVLLYKIASTASWKLKLNSVISWENIWQVSTQTLSNLEIMSSFEEFLHIRPLICYDKNEIIKIARNIWTFNFSEKIKETCQIESHSDSMVKKSSFVLDLFESLNLDLNEILKDTYIIKDSIDISKIERYRVKVATWEVINIENWEKIPKLESWKAYTFVCSSGYKASTLMLKTREKWFETYFLVK